jgi:preprotein translocase subunit SecA
MSASFSSAAKLPRPGLLYGDYPQRTQARPGLLAELADAAGHALLPRLTRRAPDFARCLQHERERSRRLARRPQAPGGGAASSAVVAAGAAAGTEASDLDRRLAAVRAGLARHGLSISLVARAQVLIAQAMEQTLGKRPYDTQHHAAWAMLRDRLVEMDTGEGKSLAILMAAATAGLAGMPVHVITANDYLAERDARAARPLLARLGLGVAAIAPDMPAAARRAAYACPVVYCTARELGFDYLRDRMSPQAKGVPVSKAEPPLLRGLCLALIDEADSVLIDHARTPLVIAAPDGPAPGVSALAAAIYEFSARLQPGTDFVLEAADRRAEPSAAALRRLHEALAALPPQARPADPRIGALGLAQALVVRHLLQRDRHYLVQPQPDGSAGIVLIDDTTGRKLPGTTWTGGIQEFVALKEGCPAPARLRTAQQISLQALFSRYWKLGGVSGTLRESCAELFAFYRLRVQRIAPRSPSLRRDQGLRLFADRGWQFGAVLASVQARSAQGQPVLVGTDSVATSEALAAYLQRAGLAVTVLNARHDEEEARLIARAGARGAITVTTNMAGRGTDIELDGAAAAAGLHVIACSLNASRRIDRQLFGRTARNGRPGSCEMLLALNDGVFDRWLPLPLRALVAAWSGPRALPRPLGWMLARGLQKLQSQVDLLQRWRLVQQDRRAQELLAYARERQ